MRKTIVLMALMGAAISVIGGCQSKKEDANARFQALYKAEWKWRDEQLASGEDAQKPIVDHLPKVDQAAQETRLKYWEDLLTKLDAIPRAELSPEEQVNYDV